MNFFMDVSAAFGSIKHLGTSDLPQDREMFKPRKAESYKKIPLLQVAK